MPGEQERKLELKSISAYDAAVFCASMTAAQRLKQEQELEEQTIAALRREGVSSGSVRHQGLGFHSVCFRGT